ncbi:MAG: hypothetical protein NC081_06850 [Roseburia sp.]|nr:hypothetical protein [Roseburia sp.]
MDSTEFSAYAYGILSSIPDPAGEGLLERIKAMAQICIEEKQGETIEECIRLACKLYSEITGVKFEVTADEFEEIKQALLTF